MAPPPVTSIASAGASMNLSPVIVTFPLEPMKAASGEALPPLSKVQPLTVVLVAPRKAATE